MASCIAGYDSVGVFFPVGTPERKRLPSLARTVEDRSERLQADATAVDDNVLRYF